MIADAVTGKLDVREAGGAGRWERVLGRGRQGAIPPLRPAGRPQRRLGRVAARVGERMMFGARVCPGEPNDRESDIDLLLLTSEPLAWEERDRITDGVFDIQLKSERVPA